MYNNYSNPTQTSNNILIVKQHLKKPIVLILGIISVLFAIAQVFAAISSLQAFSYLDQMLGEMQWIVILLVFALIVAALSPVFLTVAFFSMYSASCDNSPYRTPVFGASALRGAGITSLISTLTCSFTVVLIIVIQESALEIRSSGYTRRYSSFYYSNISAPAYIDSATLTGIIIGILLGCCLVLVPVILYSCGLMSMGSAIKSSVLTGQLHTGGSTLLGVSSILLAIGMFIIWIIAVTENDNIPAMTHFSCILVTLNYILMAVFALGYKTHVMQNADPYSHQSNYYYTNSNQPASNHNTYANPYSTPDTNPTPYQQAANTYNNVNDYTQSTPSQEAVARSTSSANTATVISDSDMPFCPECNSPVTQNQLFCGNCGAKLK